MLNSKRSVMRAAALALAAVFLSACASSNNAGAAQSAGKMTASEVSLVQPAGPQSAGFSRPEVSPASQTVSTSVPAKQCNESNLISPNERMRTAPYPQPRRFNEFTKQGAANVVAYYTYAAYYSFVSRKTDVMRQVFTQECDKCMQMANWVDKFVAKNATVVTGVPNTDIIDVYPEDQGGRSVYWVVAHNQEPAIIGCQGGNTAGGYDSPSTGKALYRVESVEGKNMITGIFKVPSRYQ